MDKIANKNKVETEALEAYDKINGREVILELLKTHGVSAFPDNRFISIKFLIEKALIIYGLKFNSTNKGNVQYRLMRYYRTNNYEICGQAGSEQIKMKKAEFDEAEKWEKEFLGNF